MKRTYKDYVLVGIQLLLFALYMLELFNSYVQLACVIQIIGMVTAFIGFGIVGLAMLQLNKNLSPFPSPKSNSTLIQNGLFKYVRHPIYSGLLLLFGGYAVYAESWYKLCISILLLMLFIVKSHYEERQLTKQFPEYANYQLKTGWFFPKTF